MSSFTRTRPPRSVNQPVASSRSFPSSSVQPGNPGAVPKEEPERKFEHRGGYAVLAPDNAKRDRIQRLAEKERRDHETRKKASTHMYTTTTGTVGGSSASAVTSSRLVNKSTRTSGKLPSLRSQSLHADDGNVRQHLARQRQKAERNSAKEKDRQKHLDQDRQQKNNAFLDRLQNS